MKKFLFLPIALVIAVMVSSCKETKVQNVKMENASDSLSYAIGYNIGQSFKQQKILDVNTEMMALVINAIIHGDTLNLKMNDSSSIAFLNTYMRKKQEAEDAAAKEEGRKWLEENAKKPGVKTTPSGLQYEVINTGNGLQPTDNDTVVVNYTGKLIDGTVFDSSIQTGQPATFRIRQVVAGWAEGLKMMHEGDKWNLYVPSELGYGPQGYQGVIPPNATLVFELELVKVKPGKPAPVK